jgi:hypothetical protein
VGEARSPPLGILFLGGFGDTFQAAWVAARFRGQFQEPDTVNLGQNFAFLLFPILEIFLFFSFHYI